MRFLRNAILLTPFALPAAAQSINGSFNGDQCGLDYRNELALDIAWPVISFYESACTITSSTPVPGIANTFVYSGSCIGEGEEWTRSFLILPDNTSGVVVVQDGFAEIYRRCGS